MSRTKPNYRYGRQNPKKTKKKGFLLLLIVLLLAGFAGLLIYKDIISNGDTAVEGKSNTVAQASTESIKAHLVNEPYFSMELPHDWKEIDRKNVANEKSITWQATAKGQDNRSLKLYIDVIPSDIAINRLLPVSAQSNRLSYGTVSDNCANFTKGGTMDAGEASKLPPTPAKWQKVDFICDLPRFIDNQIGTGTPGSINSVSIAGPSKGGHKYFFLYIDRNFQPDHNILYNAIKSFEAK